MKLKLISIPIAIACASFAAAQNGWMQHGHDPYHTGLSNARMKPLAQKLWSVKIDRDPQYSGTSLLIHYMSPLVTPNNTVVIAVKTSAGGDFLVQGRSGTDGTLLWSQPTNWVMPDAGWKPLMGLALFPNPSDPAKTSVAIADAGGKLIIRDDADAAVSTKRAVVFYGNANYNAHKNAYNQNVLINTPITADAQGNLFFGYQTIGVTPIGLQSGLARVGRDGSVRYNTAKAMARDSGVGKIATNCAPALRRGQNWVYFATNGGTPYLVCVDATTLAPLYRRALVDPNNNNPANVSDISTASPMVAPNGDVYYGILENPLGTNHYRGWLLHFDMRLNPVGVPGAFGWDYTPSLVPATAVPGYTGTSEYLLACKYNHYASTGGNGANKLALLDPNDTVVEPVTGLTVMKPVQTILSPTQDRDYPSNPDAKREWCVNTIAVDWRGKAALVSCEDGRTYKWDFTTNSLGAGVKLNDGIGQAYTPTVIGPDGNGYAISNGVLYCLGKR
jgi:hypothetical protein